MFSVLLNYPQKMPKRFVKHFGPKLPDNMILVGRNGHDWPVRLARSSSTDSIVFIGGGWKRFVEEQSLQVGDILVFRYGGDFRFDVLTFDHESGCEKTKPFFTNMRRSNTDSFHASFFHCQEERHWQENASKYRHTMIRN